MIMSATEGPLELRALGLAGAALKVKYNLRDGCWCALTEINLHEIPLTASMRRYTYDRLDHE